MASFEKKADQPSTDQNHKMKNLLTALVIASAFTAPVALAQTLAPAATVAADPAALTAANEMLASMNYRSMAQSMFEQMRQTMPAMIRQAATVSIDNNAQIDPAQKKAALDKMNAELPQAMDLINGVFADASMLDEMMQETAHLYARYYTVDELRQIATFYKTPVGAKLLATMPQVMNESMQMGQRVVMPRVAAVMKKMQAK